MRSVNLALCLVASLALPLVSGCASHGDDGSEAAAGQDLSASASSARSHGGATRFHQLKQGPTDKTMGTLFTAGGKVDSSLVGTYKFLVPTNEPNDAGLRETRVKEVMHRFMCSFFDDSIDISHRTGAAGAKQADDDLDLDTNLDGADESGITSAMGKIATDGDLDLLSGTAGGNNTFGNVVGVYDKKHNEILFFGFSNCGSDN